MAGAPVDWGSRSAAACIYGYWDHLPVYDYQLFYWPGVAAGFFPTNDAQVCVFVACPRRRFRSEARLGVAQLYAQLLSGRPRRAGSCCRCPASGAAEGVRGG